MFRFGDTQPPSVPASPAESTHKASTGTTQHAADTSLGQHDSTIRVQQPQAANIHHTEHGTSTTQSTTASAIRDSTSAGSLALASAEPSALERQTPDHVQPSTQTQPTGSHTISAPSTTNHTTGTHGKETSLDAARSMPTSATTASLQKSPHPNPQPVGATNSLEAALSNGWGFEGEGI